MRALMLIAAGPALMLAACLGEQSSLNSAGTVAGAALDATVATKPADVAGKTTLDEALGIAATNAYTAASRLGTALARAGLIDRAGFKAADQRGYDAVLALRSAYLAGNAANYADAITRAQKAAADIAALVR